MVKLAAENGYWLTLQSNDRKEIDKHVEKFLDKRFEKWTILEGLNLPYGQRWFYSLEQAQKPECKAFRAENMDREKTKTNNLQHLALIYNLARPMERNWTLFLGDSILDHISNPLYSTGCSIVAAVGGDRTEHLIWRLTEGKLMQCIKDTVRKVDKIVLLIGHNNLERDDASDIFSAICAIYQLLVPVTKNGVIILPIPPCLPAENGKYKNRPLEFYEKWSSLNKMISSACKDTFHFFDDFKNRSDFYNDHVHFSYKGNQHFLSCLAKLLHFDTSFQTETSFETKTSFQTETSFQTQDQDKIL